MYYCCNVPSPPVVSSSSSLPGCRSVYTSETQIRCVLLLLEIGVTLGKVKYSTHIYINIYITFIRHYDYYNIITILYYINHQMISVTRNKNEGYRSGCDVSWVPISTVG